MIAIGQQAREVIKRLAPQYPTHTALRWSTPIDLLVAVVLSAQCTDERVNKVTVSLFQKYKTAGDYAAADPAALEVEIQPTGFYRNKAKNIMQACAVIAGEHGGVMPRAIEDMTALPGIGRKSANIILAEVYGLMTGIAVDTHVKRVAKRLGLTGHTDPEKIEAELMPEVPRDDWYNLSTVLIYHGRAVCVARKPKCGECVLNDICPSAFTFD